MHRTIVSLLISALALTTISCIDDKEGDDIIKNYVHVGDQLPDFTVTDAQGEKVTSNIISGKKGMLIFFLSTCGDCKRELPVLDQVHKSLNGTQDYTAMAVSRQEATDTVVKFWDNNSYTIPYYMDFDRSAFSLFANSTVPRVYIFDRNGKVVWMAIEKIDITAAEIVQIIESL